MRSRQRRYLDTEKGRRNAQASAKRYRNTPAGKTYVWNYNHSEAGKETRRRYRTSEKGALVQKRYYSSEKGKVVARRAEAKRQRKGARDA